eukprot:5860-Chlamydomonas_euryale.AAC.1
MAGQWVRLCDVGLATMCTLPMHVRHAGACSYVRAQRACALKQSTLGGAAGWRQHARARMRAPARAVTCVCACVRA